jgi:hypothetical protein
MSNLVEHRIVSPHGYENGCMPTTTDEEMIGFGTAPG